MNITLGVSPVSWSNDDLPELGGECTVEACLQDASELGFVGIELGNKFPRVASELKPLMAHYDMEIIGGWYSGSLLKISAEDEIEKLQDHLTLLKQMGSKVFIFAECSNTIHSNEKIPHRNKAILSPIEWCKFGQKLSIVAKYISSEGMRFAYHYHAGTIVETAAELELLFEHTCDEVGLVLDTGHAYWGDINCEEVIRRYPNRVSHVHFKDVRKHSMDELRKENLSFLQGVKNGVFTVPGDGTINFAPILEALGETGYSGWIVLEAEQDPKLADPREYAKNGLNYLKYIMETLPYWKKMA